MITNATITDRSSGPAGGTIRLSGFSTGSVTSNINSKIVGPARWWADATR